MEARGAEAEYVEPALVNAPDAVREQMSLAYAANIDSVLGTNGDGGKRETGPDPERQRLNAKYADRVSDRLEFGPLCTYVPNKKAPIHRWFKYKEGFSPALVQRILTGEWRLARNARILDPFAGSGTTLVACQQLGYASTGVEVMPVSVFVSRVKLCNSYDTAELSEASDQLLGLPYSEAGRLLPDVRIISLAFTPQIQDELAFLRDSILSLEGISEETRNFLLLGLLSILEEVSSTSKDGQFLRLVERHVPPVRPTLGCRLAEMISDLQVVGDLFSDSDSPAPAAVFQGDARSLPLGPEYESTFDGVITSPPYLNRYDYSRTYSLELLLLFAGDFASLKNIRHSLLRSHIESRVAPTDDARMPALMEILDNISWKRLNNPRIPIMIKGYFEDMNLVIREMHRVCKPGARVALVVANARFEGELTPVDLMLSELAEAAGFTTEAIWATRYKGNSSQQMGRYGRIAVRESIVFWRKL